MDLSRKQLVLVVAGVLMAGFTWVCGFIYLFSFAYSSRPQPGRGAEFDNGAVVNLIVFGPIAVLGLISAYWTSQQESDSLSSIQFFLALVVRWVLLLVCAYGSSVVFFYFYVLLQWLLPQVGAAIGG